MRYDDPDVPASAVVGILGAVLLFVIIVGLQGLFYSMEKRELTRKIADDPYEPLKHLDADQRGVLNSYGWVDQKEQIVHIPIHRAMELVVEESQTAE